MSLPRRLLRIARWEASRGRSPAKEAARAEAHARTALGLDANDEEAKSLLSEASVLTRKFEN